MPFSSPRRRTDRWMQRLQPWRAVVLTLAVLLGLSALERGLVAPTTASGQEEKLDDVDAERAGAGAAAGGKRSGKRGDGKAGMPADASLLDLFLASGAIGMLITLLSLVAVGFIVEHALTLRQSKLIPPGLLEELTPLIAAGKIDEAIEACGDPANDSLVAEVVLAGLERYKGSEFGFAEYKSAVEEAGEDSTSKLYRKTEILSVIGTIAPMLGLLGTVQGMILAFQTIAAKGGMARPDELAGSISLALVTTFEGLIVAIPAMVAFSYFRNKIDSLVAEAGKRIERTMMPLGRRRTS